MNLLNITLMPERKIISSLPLICLSIFVCTNSAFADIIFSLYPNDGKEVKCEFVTMINKKITCQEDNLSLIYPINQITKIVIVRNSKEYLITSIDEPKYEKIEKAINLLNSEKKKMIADEKKRTAEIKRKNELAAKSQSEAETGGEDLFEAMARCERECSVSKYSYDKVCHDGCMIQFMVQ